MASSITHTQVPAGMSYVNAIYALWQGSGSRGILQDYPYLRSIQINPLFGETAEKVHELFMKEWKYGSQCYVDYYKARPIKTFFENFPKLDASMYDELFGQNAAQTDLDQYYASVPSGERFDQGDRCLFSDIKK